MQQRILNFDVFWQSSLCQLTNVDRNVKIFLCGKLLVLSVTLTISHCLQMVSKRHIEKCSNVLNAIIAGPIREDGSSIFPGPEWKICIQMMSHHLKYLGFKFHVNRLNRLDTRELHMPRPGHSISNQPNFRNLPRWPTTPPPGSPPLLWFLWNFITLEAFKNKISNINLLDTIKGALIN